MKNDNDLINLLLDSEDSPHGAHNHLGWKTFAGDKGQSIETRLTSLHESFHNELNNLTVYGFLLQVYALLAKANSHERYKTLLQKFVNQCRNAHEIYATFQSVSITLEQKGNENLKATDLLKNYPNYLRYYQQGKLLSDDFQGNYLKEIALGAVIIVCFQSENIVSKALDNLRLFQLEQTRSSAFPDSRLSFIARNLPKGFLRHSFDVFCEINKDAKGVNIFQNTEKKRAYYQQAIVMEYDSLQRDLQSHMVNDLTEWLNEEGQSSIPFLENMFILEDLSNKANNLLKSMGVDLEFKTNTEPLDIPKNILLNFTNEKYHIRKEKMPAILIDLREINQESWQFILSGGNDEAHHFIVSRIGSHLLAQYELSAENTQWLITYLEKPLVFLRRRIFNEKTKTFLIQLFWIENTKVWLEFKEATKSNKIISNISMLTWAIPNWEKYWLPYLRRDSESTILFDLPPHTQLEQIFGTACERVSLSKIWIEHESYRHCALVMQAEFGEKKGLSPLFFIPASETTCNVISSYAVNNLKRGLFVEDKRFLQVSSLLIRTVLSHLFNEESVFDFNTI